jgi:hypothetical protein
MTYSFACPVPCKREIKVDANDNLNAVDKTIVAGAMSCRNRDNQCSCKQAYLNMPPIPAEELRCIVSLYMREECDETLRC